LYEQKKVEAFADGFKRTLGSVFNKGSG
jgi:hypothetical protein